MNTLQKQPRKNLSWLTIVLFIAGLIIGIIIMNFIKPVNESKLMAGNEDLNSLIKQTDTLQSGFNKVQQLNESYASLLTDKNLDSSKLVFLDSLNVSIIKTESGFLKTLDNLQIDNEAYNSKSSTLLKKIAAAYRSVLNTGDALNATRNAFNIGNTNFSFDQKMLHNMQNELSTKEQQVQALTLQLSIMRRSDNKDANAEYAGFLRQQDSVTNKVIAEQKKRTENLVSYNDKLKRDNDNLRSQVETLTNSALQQQQQNNNTPGASTLELNDQLKLAKADCYLSRADAAQTISNAKQRKDLLQNALQILNPLSQSSNSNIKQQAQLKLTELKNIAANNHD